MTLRNLEVFLQVIDAGSMRAAADRLYISQPSVSDAVAQLEQEYAVRLFERLGRRLYLTEAGRTLEGYARQLLHLSDEVARRMSDLTGAGELSVGATVTVGSSVLCDILAALPIQTHVIVENMRAIEALLLASSLDVALVEGTVESDRLLTEPVIADELLLALPASHPLAAAPGAVAAAALENEPFIFREAGSATRELFERALAGAGVRVRPVWECHNTEAILRAVETGQGLSVLSGRLLAARVEAGSIVTKKIDGCDLTRRFSLVRHRDKFLTPSLLHFMEACRQFGQNEPLAEKKTKQDTVLKNGN